MFPSGRNLHRRADAPALNVAAVSNRQAGFPPSEIAEAQGDPHFIQGGCLAGLFLVRRCRIDDLHRFSAMIAVIIEGIIEGLEPFKWDHGQQGVP